MKHRLTNSPTIPIASVVVGTRYRKDNGDLTDLLRSLETLGMLQPIGITHDLELVFGGRRIAAAKTLGWTEVPYVMLDTIAGAVAALKAERDENKCRKEMTARELVTLGKEIEAIEAAAAKGRMRSGTNQHTKPCGKLPQGSNGKTRDKVASALGVSGKTYEKAKQVAHAAKENPEKYGDLPELMDSQSISAAHNEMQSRMLGDKYVPPSGVEIVKGLANRLREACAGFQSVAPGYFGGEKDALIGHINSAISLLQAALTRQKPVPKKGKK